MKKVAIFLMLLGAEKGQRILAQMDTAEIKTVVEHMQSLTILVPELQERVWQEFVGLGYSPELTPAQTLMVIRCFCHDQQRRNGSTAAFCFPTDCAEGSRGGKK